MTGWDSPAARRARYGPASSSKRARWAAALARHCCSGSTATTAGFCVRSPLPVVSPAAHSLVTPLSAPVPPSVAVRLSPSGQRSAVTRLTVAVPRLLVVVVALVGVVALVIAIDHLARHGRPPPRPPGRTRRRVCSRVGEATRRCGG